MKRITNALAFILSIIAWNCVGAQTASSREFITLKEQRDRAVAAAVAPIDGKYHSLLKSLLTKATQEGDFDTVKKVTEVLSANTPASAVTKGATAAHETTSTGIWALSTDEKYWFALSVDEVGTVDGLLFVGDATKRVERIVGKREGDVLAVRWASVHIDLKWEGQFTPKPDGGFTVTRIDLDGPQKGRKTMLDLIPVNGDNYKKAMDVAETKTTDRELKAVLKKFPKRSKP